MTIAPQMNESRQAVNAERRMELRRLAREVNARLGICETPTMTLEELHASMIAHGVRPEDNSASRELLRMRYGEDYDQIEVASELQTPADVSPSGE